MDFTKIKENKKQYLPLLLIADEDERMIDRYLERGTMYVLSKDGTKAVCVVTDEGDGVLEIKNLAVEPKFQKMGYGRKMLEYIENTFKSTHEFLQVGTGDSPLTVPFYEKCGFVRSHVVKDFFINNYAHPICECGVLLRDMIYLKKQIKE